MPTVCCTSPSFATLCGSYNIPGYLNVAMNVFTTFAPLDPRYFICTGLCLYPGATPVQHETLHFLHPLAILTVVFTIAAIGRYFPRLALLSGETAVQAICFLAFTSVAVFFIPSSAPHVLLAHTSSDVFPHICVVANNYHVVDGVSSGVMFIFLCFGNITFLITFTSILEFIFLERIVCCGNKAFSITFTSITYKDLDRLC